MLSRFLLAGRYRERLVLQDHNAAKASPGCLSYIVIPVALGTAIIEALLTRPPSEA